MSTKINKKIESIYLLMGKLVKGEELYPQSVDLQEEFFEESSASAERGLRRYLDDIHDLYGHMLLTEKKKKDLTERKVTVYRVVDRKKDVSDILKFFMENSDDLSWVLQMIHENDPSFLRDMDDSDKFVIEQNIKEDEGIFLFKSSPFENLDEGKQKEIFNKLKKAVKNHEYCSIEYEKKKVEIFEALKCLKMLYMNNNWYLAAEDDEKQFRLLRLSFIKNVTYAKNGKVTFQVNRLEHYSDYFASVQNAMTLANKEFKKATLKASPRIALYFEEKMKPFFPSQEYVKTEEDGSVVFTVMFTQNMELLPFVKQWMPSIEVISPTSLKKALVKDLNYAIEIHS